MTPSSLSPLHVFLLPFFLPFPLSLSLPSPPPSLCKVLCTLLMVPSICDLGKSIWQAVWLGVATSDTLNATIVAHEVVAPVQIVTPIVFVIDMVRWAVRCTGSFTGEVRHDSL